MASPQGSTPNWLKLSVVSYPRSRRRHYNRTNQARPRNGAGFLTFGHRIRGLRVDEVHERRKVTSQLQAVVPTPRLWIQGDRLDQGVQRFGSGDRGFVLVDRPFAGADYALRRDFPYGLCSRSWGGRRSCPPWSATRGLVSLSQPIPQSARNPIAPPAKVGASCQKRREPFRQSQATSGLLDDWCRSDNEQGAQLLVAALGYSWPAPTEWSGICFRFWHEGGLGWRGTTSLKRSSSASCVRLRVCWRRAGRLRMRAAGLASRSRAIIASARSMAVWRWQGPAHEGTGAGECPVEAACGWSVAGQGDLQAASLQSYKRRSSMVCRLILSPFWMTVSVLPK